MELPPQTAKAKKAETESSKSNHWHQSSSGSRTFTKKSHNLSCSSSSVNRTGFVGKIASAFSEPNSFKIITWADKKNSTSANEEFLYQNVSNSGTNYLEYKLKNIMEDNNKFGNSNNTNKVETGNKEKRDSSETAIISPTWISSAPTRQIQVQQIKNKTVVKISVNDCPKSDSYFKPLRQDDLESDYQYPGIVFERKPKADQINEYAEPYSGQVYANVDLSKKRKNQQQAEAIIYENSETEQHPANGPDDTDQVYENEDFTVLRNSQVTQSIIQMNALPTRQDVYENTQFLTKANTNNVLEAIQFSGPGMNEIVNNYQTPRSVRVVLDPEMLKTNNSFDGAMMIKGEQDDGHYSLESDPDAKVIVTVNGHHKRAESITSSGVGVDSEEVSDTEESSNISCDSLNSNDLHTSEDHGYHTPTSENKTASPIDDNDYQNINVKADFDATDIIQQVANAAQRIKNLRIENTGLYLARRIEAEKEQDEEEEEEEDEEEIYENGVKTLPKGLLNDIRNVKNLSIIEKKMESPKGIIKLFENNEVKDKNKRVVINERTYEDRKKTDTIISMQLDTDKFYKFHLFENAVDTVDEKQIPDDETFAGYRDYLNRERPAAITSSKGTIRGVKNRVKAGIATFLQLQENKAYKDKDAGKVVVYSTTMGIVRETYQKCLKVKQILKTLLVKFEERDVFMSTEAQEEIRERMKCDAILVPQVFVEGQHIGDAETIERLNETGELRKILKPYKSADASATCNVCGGYRLLPCRICKGSKKSIHRNHFTAEFVSLKCMNCDPVGLMKCYAC